MLKMSYFYTNTETYAPLITCVIDNTCSKPCQTLIKHCFSSSMSLT